MAKYVRLSLLLVIAALLLAGCFREASPGLEPTVDVGQDSSAQEAGPGTGLDMGQDGDAAASPTPTTDALATPFVTPFGAGEGPDADALPTLAEPSPTLELVVGDDEAAADDEAAPPADDQPADQDSAPQVTNTAPFAAGPTFTPMPGAPTADPNAGILPPTATITPRVGGTPTEDPCTYTVQAGDSAFYIATINGTTLDELIEANSLQDPDYLYEGQVLEIPGCGANAPTGDEDEEPVADVTDDPAALTEEAEAPAVTSTPPPAGTTIHVVQQGQNLFRISQQYGVTVADIVQANGFANENVIIHPGDELIIPVPGGN